MKDREVGVENGKEDNEEEGEEEVMAIDVDVYVGFPIRLSPNGSTATEEHMPAERARWALSSILSRSPIFFPLSHDSPRGLFCKNNSKQPEKPFKNVRLSFYRLISPVYR